MLFRNLAIQNKLKLLFNPVNSKFFEILNNVKNFETPERFKGTFVENWGKYWKNLFIDYKEVAIDIAKDCKERPVRASVYISVLGSCYYFHKCNPNECSFKEKLIENTVKVMQVGDPIRNPVTVQHLKWLDQCYNEGIVRRLNLGIMSLIWLDNYDETCSLYKAVCPYLKPRYLTFYERVIDIGFLNIWWILENKMTDYDVNETEFRHLETAKSDLSTS